MNGRKVVLAIILLILGLIGVASILTMEIPIPEEAESMLKARFSDGQIKLLLLLNPTILLLIAILVGTLLYKKVQLSVPFIERLLGIESQPFEPDRSIKYGIVGGVFAGILLTIVGLIFLPLLPAEFKELGESLQPSIAARLLYGGFTEELLMRFGLMTLIIWIASKIAGNLKPSVYWVGIIVVAIVFGLGHFPVAFQAVEEPSITLLSYILIGNSIGGVIFGWLYWKKGLESAFLAHIFAHIILLLAEPLLA